MTVKLIKLFNIIININHTYSKMFSRFSIRDLRKPKSEKKVSFAPLLPDDDSHQEEIANYDFCYHIGDGEEIIFLPCEEEQKIACLPEEEYVEVLEKDVDVRDGPLPRFKTPSLGGTNRGRRFDKELQKEVRKAKKRDPLLVGAPHQPSPEKKGKHSCKKFYRNRVRIARAAKRAAWDWQA